MIPTSNHNMFLRMLTSLQVVYLLIPTSNHNRKYDENKKENVVYLLIPTSNHNPTTNVGVRVSLYIFWFLHQTTTNFLGGLFAKSCISFDSYIKPQLGFLLIMFRSVVYLLIPTSNHNSGKSIVPVLAVVYLLIPTSNHNLWFLYYW